MRRTGFLAVTVLLALGGTALDTSSASQSGSTVAVRASRRGFSPASLTVRRGETTELVLSSADDEHCFAVDELRIEKRIVPGRQTRFELTPERSGTFTFHCCLESGEAAQTETGRLIVTE